MTSAIAEFVSNGKVSREREGYVRNGTVSKAERFGWKTLDSPGAYERIPKTNLLIDRGLYQRDEVRSKVLAMAREWSWSACGVILVARRREEGGATSDYVYDGQQRVLAARQRADIDLLDCMVYEFEGLREEVKAFLRANTLRKPVSSYDKYRARLAVEDEAAVRVNSLVKGSNYAVSAAGVSDRPGEVRCIASLSRAAQTDWDALRRVWTLLAQIAGGEFIHHEPIMGLVYLEARMNRAGKSLTDNFWRRRLLSISYQGLRDDIKKVVNFQGKGGSRVWADGVMLALNKGLVKNRLSFDTDA